MYVHVPLFVPKPFLDQSRNGAYGGAVACIDWSTGVIVDWLKQLGLFENTLIVFTSDNGSRAQDEGGSNAPCRGTKATTWEGGQRVPCIAHWPAAIEPGRVCSGVARSIDFFPTFSAAAGLAEAPGLPIDGEDLMPVLRGEVDRPRNESMFYYLHHQLEAVRVGEWKLHFMKGSPAGERRSEMKELYNLREDPGETINRYEEQLEVVERLEQAAAEMRERLGDTATKHPGTEVRESGKVEAADTLTEYDESHPYIIAMYDLPDMPTMSG